MTHRGISRRRFLATLPALGGAGLLPGLGIYRDAQAAPAASHTLLCIHLVGGNDSLNTVVPYTDPYYAKQRPSIALPRSKILPLTATLGLNAAMPGLKALFDHRQLAIVTGVGYPGFSYSHLDARSIYDGANPQRANSDGWLGRALEQVTTANDEADLTTDALIGAALATSPASLTAGTYYPPLLPGSAGSSFLLPAYDSRQLGVLQQLARAAPSARPLLNGVMHNLDQAFALVGKVGAANALTTPVAYPRTGFAQSLLFAVDLLRADPGVRVLTLQQGGYDTHVDQVDLQATLLADLSSSLVQFFADLKANGLSDRVTVMVWSEFGRRVAENASHGTDHGSAQSLLLMGTGVRGGIYGNPPNLDPAALVEGGNLPMQVDFRSVYATLLDNWLGIDSTAVLGDAFTKLPLFL